jgi:hypothetical protein
MQTTEGIVVVVEVVVEVEVATVVVCDATDSDFEALIAVELSSTVTLFVPFGVMVVLLVKSLGWNVEISDCLD